LAQPLLKVEEKRRSFMSSIKSDVSKHSVERSLDDQNWENEGLRTDTEDATSERANNNYGLSLYEDVEGSGDFLNSLGSMTSSTAAQKLKSLLSDASLKLSAKDKSQISSLISKLKPMKGKIPADLLTELKKIEAKFIGMEEMSGDDMGQDQDSKPLKRDLEDFKASLQSNPNLSEDEKKLYIKNIEKWSTSLDLNSSASDSIQEQFEIMKDEISKASTFPKATRDLAKLVGKDASELQALLLKYGLDPEHLPNPPDDKVAAFLEDPEFSDKFTSLKEGVATANKDLSDEIAKQTKIANDLNAETLKDKDKERSSDVSSYEFLYKAYFHHDDKSTALISARQQVAKEAASYLSALYGKEVKVEMDPKKAGAVSFEGQSLNVIGSANQDGSAISIKFSSNCNIDWPKVELVSFGVDNYGDGKTQIPQWMKDAHYPMHLYDTYDDHSTSIWWNLLGGVSWIANAVEGSKKGDDLPAAGELMDIEISSNAPTSSTHYKTGSGGTAKGYL